MLRAIWSSLQAFARSGGPLPAAGTKSGSPAACRGDPPSLQGPGRPPRGAGSPHSLPGGGPPGQSPMVPGTYFGTSSGMTSRPPGKWGGRPSRTVSCWPWRLSSSMSSLPSTGICRSSRTSLLSRSRSSSFGQARTGSPISGHSSQPFLPRSPPRSPVSHNSLRAETARFAPLSPTSAPVKLPRLSDRRGGGFEPGALPVGGPGEGRRRDRGVARSVAGEKE